MSAKSIASSAAVLVLSATCLGGTATAGQQITVRLASGRAYAAEVDQRTSDQRLWLRFSGESATILRPVDWERVVSASVQGQEISADELRQRSAQLKARPSAPRAPAEHNGNDATFAEQARRALAPEVADVQTIGTDAYIANWDGDVEADGLVVHLWAYSHGAAVRIQGTLEVEWLGAMIDGDQPPRRRARWTRAARLEDFGPAGAVFLLPFQAAHPEFDLRQAAVGMVRVRFSAPGCGTFEQTLSDVRVRPYSPQRDRIQQRTNKRFLPLERTGRTR